MLNAMATRWIWICVIASLALASAARDACAQSEASTAGDGHAGESLAIAPSAERVLEVVVDAADAARAIAEPKTRLSCWLDAAQLLWPTQPDRARELFVAGFEELDRRMAAPDADLDQCSDDFARLLVATARRDPALAEKFSARVSEFGPSGLTDRDQRARILVDTAVAMLPDDVGRAAALGRLALSYGVSQPVIGLAIVMKGVDAKEADGLYAAALAVFSRQPNPTIADLAMIASYIGADGNRSLDGVAPDALRGYLALAVQQIEATPLDSSDVHAAYFLGRSLVATVARYVPDAAVVLESRLAVMSRAAGFQRVAQTAGQPAKTGSEDPIVADAMSAANRGDVKAVYAQLPAIPSERDRAGVLARTVRVLLASNRSSEIGPVIERVPFAWWRSRLFVETSVRAQSEGNTAAAALSLAAAEREAAREDVTALRVLASHEVVAAWTGVDTERAFGALAGYVATLNKATLAVGDAPRQLFGAGEQVPTYLPSFGALASVDFERALLIARQIDNKGQQCLAELAVCHAALAASSDGVFDDDATDEESR